MSARKFDVFKPKKYDNVKVTHMTDGDGRVDCIYVRLHQTVVVKYDVGNGVVYLDSGGWTTVTTKTAINTALKQIPGFQGYAVYQKARVWYVNGEEFKDGMILAAKEAAAS